jgi:predicted ATPase
LTLFADALDLAPGNGELFYVAEILRLTAQAWLAQPAPDNSHAERYLLEALETSRRQEAKFWELRAAVDTCQTLVQRRTTDRSVIAIGSAPSVFS